MNANASFLKTVLPKESPSTAGFNVVPEPGKFQGKVIAVLAKDRAGFALLTDEF